ncbi:MAG: hypothetical protein O7B99_09225 [Planctomycetota bacterium]|nr:hypothetical protein [Planctomycetota bacterium]
MPVSLEHEVEGCTARVEAGAPGDLPGKLHREVLTDEGGLRGCLACGHPELYTQKDFPRRVGIGIVVVAAVLAPFTWYASLAIAALLDWLLFRFAPNAVVCYVCSAKHRGFLPSPKHPIFDREIEERLRYGAKAVMGKPMREGGTADAPEPEH